MPGPPSELRWRPWLQGHVGGPTDALCRPSAQRHAAASSQESLFQRHHRQREYGHPRNAQPGRSARCPHQNPPAGGLVQPDLQPDPDQTKVTGWTSQVNKHEGNQFQMHLLPSQQRPLQAGNGYAQSLPVPPFLPFLSKREIHPFSTSSLVLLGFCSSSGCFFICFRGQETNRVFDCRKIWTPSCTRPPSPTSEYDTHTHTLPVYVLIFSTSQALACRRSEMFLVSSLAETDPAGRS